jgi:hypothetical protein
MIRYMLPVTLICLLMGIVSGTIWLNPEPYYMQLGPQYSEPFLQPKNLTPLEIVNSPLFPLLGQGFTPFSMPVEIQPLGPAEVKATGTLDASPMPVTFSGELEKNLRYAQTRSSLRVGQAGNWTTMSFPWLVR